MSRLHYTLATGDICSKEGAARYALATFPEWWHRVVNEVLRIRRANQAGPGAATAVTAQVRESLRLRHTDQGRSLYRTPLARRRDVLAFGDMVVTGARRLHLDRSPGRSG